MTTINGNYASPQVYKNENVESVKYNTTKTNVSFESPKTSGVENPQYTKFDEAEFNFNNSWLNGIKSDGLSDMRFGFDKNGNVAYMASMS